MFRIRFGKARGLLVHAVVHHGRHQQVRDAGRRLARAEAQEGLLRHPLAGDAQGRKDPGHRDRGRALDVVIEAAHLVPVVPEQPEGVVVGEVLELDDDSGERLLGGLDELVNEVVERGA